MKINVRVTGIEYDTEDADHPPKNVPSEMTVAVDVDDPQDEAAVADAALDAVSDETGWCVKSARYQIVPSRRANMARKRNPRIDRRGTWRGDFFRVTVSEAEVDKFARSWPGSGLAGRGGFAAEFNADTGDLVDLEGWPSQYGGNRVPDYSEAALSALIDDMKEHGMKKSGGRTANPIRSKAQHRLLFAKMRRGEITKKQLWKLLRETRTSYRNLPARKGRDRYGRFTRGRRGRTRNPASRYTKRGQFYISKNTGPVQRRKQRRQKELLKAKADLQRMLDDKRSPVWAIELMREYINEIERHQRGEPTVFYDVVPGRRQRRHGRKRKYATRRKNFASGMRYIRYLPAGNRIMNPGREFAVSAAYDKRSEAVAFLAKLKREGKVDAMAPRSLKVKPTVGMFSGKRRYVVVGTLKGDRRTNNPRRRNPSEADTNRRFEDLAGGPSRAFALMRLAERARQAVSGDRFSYSGPQRSAKTVFKQIAKREGFPQRAIDYYAANFM